MLDDEVYDGLHVTDDAHVLAEAEFMLKDAAPGEPAKSIPQVWTLEKDGYRAFTSIPGLRLTTFSVPAYRALLFGIAWAGRREKIDEFCTGEETAALKIIACRPVTYGSLQASLTNASQESIWATFRIPAGKLDYLNWWQTSDRLGRFIHDLRR